MNDRELNNFFKPAKELLKKLPKHSKTLTLSKNKTQDCLINNLLIHPTVLKNDSTNQLQKPNKSKEDISKYFEKTQAKLPVKEVFDREYLYHENTTLKNILKKKDLLIDELRFSNLKIDVSK